MFTKKSLFTLLFICAFSGASALADTTTASTKEGPCKSIVDACKGAGFIQGDWKKGDGLWRDCVDPIIQGQTTVPGGTKALPTNVPAAEVAACKAKRPKFGEGKVGSK